MIFDMIRAGFDSAGFILALAVLAVVGLLIAFLVTLIDSLRQR